MSEPQTCWPCQRNQHGGCIAELIEYDCVCDHSTQMKTPTPQGALGAALNLEPEEPDSKTRIRRQKNDDAVTDPNSTGRKRAAKLYPLVDKEGNKLPCDLAGKSAALPNYYEVQIDGCGIRPGTLINPAQSRHHWSYNTLDNERANIGLMCHSCHNLTHAKNDPFKAVIYERLYGFKPDLDNLRWANKALKSGIVGGGAIKSKEEFGL